MHHVKPETMSAMLVEINHAKSLSNTLIPMYIWRIKMGASSWNDDLCYAIGYVVNAVFLEDDNLQQIYHAIVS